MQKTEKHCKNQCFCYHKTTKISPKTGPKTQKSASGPGHLRNRKKRCCKPKNWGQKVEKHGVFSLFACRFWTGAFTNRCLPYCFLQCFLKASVTTYQKQEVLAEKCPPPPPGKPVTFYECHPEDHAPAPSVRADFFSEHVSSGSCKLGLFHFHIITHLVSQLASRVDSTRSWTPAVIFPTGLAQRAACLSCSSYRVKKVQINNWKIAGSEWSQAINRSSLVDLGSLAFRPATATAFAAPSAATAATTAAACPTGTAGTIRQTRGHDCTQHFMQWGLTGYQIEAKNGAEGHAAKYVDWKYDQIL